MGQQMVCVGREEVEFVQEVTVVGHQIQSVGSGLRCELKCVQSEFKSEQMVSFVRLQRYYNLNPTDMRKHSQEVPFLQELEHEQNDIAKIKEQRHLIAKVQTTIAKKDQEIDSLKALLEKYQLYQQKYSSLKLELSEKTQLITRKDQECKLFKRQLQEMVSDYQQMAKKTKQLQNDKQLLVRQRQLIQRTNKETERLFKEYQSECRRREQQLTQQLERAYHKHKEQNGKIDELEMQVEAIPSLKSKVLQLQKELEQRQSPKERTPVRPEFTQTEDLSTEVMRLQQQLLKKEEELTSQRMLNYELTLEYNQTVSSLCNLQTQVSSYRRQNTQIKQNLSQMREKHNSWMMQQKYRQSRMGTKLRSQQQSHQQEESEEESECDMQSKQQMVSTES